MPHTHKNDRLIVEMMKSFLGENYLIGSDKEAIKKIFIDSRVDEWI